MSESASARRPGRETVLAAAFFLAATVLATWPQAAHLGDGLTDVGDAKLVTRILQWDFRQTLRDPARLFELNFFYPASDVLAFSENLWGISLFGFPLLGAGAAPLVNYNVLLLLGMFLSALSAWALAREVTGDPVASLFAGVVFAFVPWRFSQLPHLPHQWGGFLCLFLLFLLRFLDRERSRDLVLFAVFFAWNALSNVHYAIFSVFAVAVVLGLHAMEGAPGSGRRIGKALVATLVGALTFVPFALAYRRASELYGMRRYFGEVRQFSGTWGDFLSAGEKNAMYGALTARWGRAEGDLFPGLVTVVLAVVALVSIRRAIGPEPLRPASESARRAARALDAVALLLAAVWMAAGAQPRLRLAGVGLEDAGRVQVVLTLVVAVRMALVVPWRRPRAGAAAWLRVSRVPPRLVLFAALGIVGVVVALGVNTPYYRFLFQSFSAVFRSIRVPTRGIVLFHVALAVLAAWGLARLRRRGPRARALWPAMALVAAGFEYRAAPLTVHPTPAAAPAVYRWLAATDLPAAVVEWPLGLQYDFDYVFRQAQHDRPIVNGYSGFFPEPYTRLEAALRQRPIPVSVWAQMGRLRAGVLVYHAHETRGLKLNAYADALEQGLDSGGLQVIRSFPHDDGLDFVFIATGTAWRAAVTAGPAEVTGARALFRDTLRQLRRDEARRSPPFGDLHLPGAGQQVPSGFWAHGWALDDSGLAAVRVAVDGVPAGEAVLGGRWPGLADVYPDYPEARTSGAFGFAIPPLAPGPHVLGLTFVGKDGGEAGLERAFTVVAPASPTRTGPGS